MTEDQAIKIISEYLKGQFPKTCGNCNHRFETLKEFYLEAKPVGNPVSYDLEAGDLQPEKPRGAVAVSYCSCGSPVALRSDGMPLFQYWALLLWAKTETVRRGITTAELLHHLRVEVRKRVIAE